MVNLLSFMIQYLFFISSIEDITGKVNSLKDPFLNWDISPSLSLQLGYDMEKKKLLKKQPLI